MEIWISILIQKQRAVYTVNEMPPTLRPEIGRSSTKSTPLEPKNWAGEKEKQNEQSWSQGQFPPPPWSPKLSKKQCSSLIPLVEKLWRTLECGATKLRGGCCWKHATVAAQLYALFLLRASSTRSLQQRLVSLCSCSLLLAKSNVFWLRNTSNIPSHPDYGNSSSSVKLAVISSGSATDGPDPLSSPIIFIPSICQCPRAQATLSGPLRYPLYTTSRSLDSFLCFAACRLVVRWNLDCFSSEAQTISSNCHH